MILSFVKGQRQINYRKPKKRGEKDGKRGISKLKIAVGVVQTIRILLLIIRNLQESRGYNTKQ